MKKKILSLVLVASMAVAGLAACGSAADSAPADNADAAPAAEATDDTSAPAEAAAPAADAAEIKIGLMNSYVNNDGGWCQATYEGVVGAMESLGMDPETQLICLESIDDTDQAVVTAAAEQLIEEGCQLIIGGSTGYASFLTEVAAAYPDVKFAQWGNAVEGLIGYEIRSYEAMFLAGYACELMSQDENTELGFSASFDEFSVRTAINAYALGAQYANPEATVQVACADTWYDTTIESQCAQSLIDKGIKYMGMEASSPAIPETCEKNGAFVVGYHNDMSALAPDAVLVSFTWNFAPVFEKIIASVVDGSAKAGDFYYEGGEAAKLTSFASFVPAEVVSQVEEVKGMIDSGELVIYGSGLTDRDGNVLVEEGSVMDDQTIIAQEFFVKGVNCAW